MERNAIAFEVERDEEDQNVTKPGAYYFIHHDEVEEPVGIVYGCPCWCGGRSILFFKGHGRGAKEWEVSGEWPTVTFTPSIEIRTDREGNPGLRGSHHWRGVLTDGVFVER